jgi:formylglycine-generating enzyme required for sulfatase activity
VDFCQSDGSRLNTVAAAMEEQLAAALARRFRIVRRLGAGGFGTVFVAEQVTVGNRQVALKVLSRKFIDEPEWLLRFQAEGAATGRIHHLNVVTIYESGQADDGTPYIAMEYLEGESLRDVLAHRGALPVEECAEILQQTAHGLNAAHKLGIIHRDLKPDNIFLTRGDEDELIVKVLDFGIAKLRESLVKTPTGNVLGTPEYMSYEQAYGTSSEALDARSDVYSLGVMVYEMLAGRRPFHSETPQGYIRKHLMEAPPPLRVAAPGRGIPASIEAVVMKALSKNRDDRHASALEFAREFRRAVSVQSPSELAETVVVPESPFGAQADWERQAREQAEAERLAAERAEAERLERERAERERLAREKAEAEQQAEQDRLAQERVKAQRLAAEKAEAERLARVKAEQERMDRIRAEAHRLEEERAKAEREARERAEAERQAREKAEAERLAAEGAAGHEVYLPGEDGGRPIIAGFEEAETGRTAREQAERERLARNLAELGKRPPSPVTVPPPPFPLTKYLAIGVGALIVIVAIVWIASRPHGTTNEGGNANEASKPAAPAPPPGMVYISGGSFMMGSDYAADAEVRPGHSVTVAPFYMDKTPVTKAKYRSYAYSAGIYEGQDVPSDEVNWPATGVSWERAGGYCAAQNERLPSEAEWEFAARGTDGRLYPWGNTFTSSLVNSSEAGLGHAEPVGTHTDGASPFGVLDMVGNVWEWCADDYKPYPGHTSPFQIPADAKVIRGGSFKSDQGHVTAMARNLDHASTRSPVIGFRCAKSM